MIIQIHVDLLASVIDKYGGVCLVFQILLLIFSVFCVEQQVCWTPLTVAQGVSHQFTQFHYKHNVHKSVAGASSVKLQNTVSARKQQSSNNQSLMRWAWRNVMMGFINCGTKQHNLSFEIFDCFRKSIHP